MEESVKLRKQLTRTRVVAIVLFIFCLVFLTYGQIQKLEADKLAETATAQRIIAEQMMEEAKGQEMIAMQQRAEADKQRMVAIQNADLAQALADCKQKKK